MRKTVFAFILLLAGAGISGQVTRDTWRTFDVFRIPLKEKINLPLRKMPVELIRAYCEGNLKAYYPNDTSKECSYHEFVAHFNVGAAQPDASEKGDEFSALPCPASFCSSNNEALLEKFLVIIELMQVKRFDRNKSMEVTDVKYVRLKFVYTKHDVEVVLDGPVFKYADIAKLAASFPGMYKVMNPKNTAENWTLKKVIDSRMFNGFVIQPPNKPKQFPENKGNNTEKDQWGN